MTNTEKYMKPKFIQPAKRIFLLAIIPFMISACSKSEDATPETEPEVITGTVPFYKVQRVENFAVETDDANPTVPKSAAYYSLENKMEIKAAFAKTARWDVGFNGLYNSFLSVPTIVPPVLNCASAGMSVTSLKDFSKIRIAPVPDAP